MNLNSLAGDESFSNNKYPTRKEEGKRWRFLLKQMGSYGGWKSNIS
jgi:hypothetical protein